MDDIQRTFIYLDVNFICLIMFEVNKNFYMVWSDPTTSINNQEIHRWCACGVRGSCCTNKLKQANVYLDWKWGRLLLYFVDQSAELVNISVEFTFVLSGIHETVFRHYLFCTVGIGKSNIGICKWLSGFYFGTLIGLLYDGTNTTVSYLSNNRIRFLDWRV